VRRQRAILAFALGSLARRGGKNLAVGAGLAFVTTLLASVLLVTSALQAEHAAARGSLPDLIVQRTVAGRPALVDPAQAAEVASLPGVRRVRPRVWGYLFYPALPGNLTLVGLPEDADDLPPALEASRDLAFEGRAPRRAGEVALGAALAERLAVGRGDEVGFPPPGTEGSFRFLRVVGTFVSSSALRTADVALMAEADARLLLGVPEGQATDLAVDLTTPLEAGVIAERVGGMFPGARVVDRSLLGRVYALTFGTRGGLVAAMLLPALAAFLLLAWDRLTGLDARERREIGVLKAVGWGTGDVLASRLWENGVIAAGGVGVGLVLAYAYVHLLRAPGLAGAILGWSELYPPFTLVPSLDLGVLATVVGVLVVPFVAVGLVPAWRAAMRDPHESLRGAG
jgi:ABC-type lipoprotein release transport system permease subunit